MIDQKDRDESELVRLTTEKKICAIDLMIRALKASGCSSERAPQW
jgi:hypothetical protein